MLNVIKKAIFTDGRIAVFRENLAGNSFSKSIVNAKAKRRQYAGTASEADKVHG